MKKTKIKNSICSNMKYLLLIGTFLFLNFNAISEEKRTDSQTTVQQSTKTIKGTVKDENNKPLPGVSVAVKGTTTGTATDINGKFEIKVKKGDVLLISFVGMEPQEVTIADQKEINITLKEKRHKVDEVIVVAYGVAKKESFTGAAQSVGAEKLADTRVESIDKALAGKISGVRITSTTGAPGAAGEIQIRGIGSISGSTSPLYVIDGIPIENTPQGHAEQSTSILNTINPDDIESMTILKDAAAASLYGSRAANGVVIITTKKGKAGETKFNFKMNLGWSEMATNSYEFMSGKELADYWKDAYTNYYLNQNKALLPTQENFGNQTIINQSIASAEGEYLADSGLDVYQNGSNWRDLIYDTGKNQDLQFSARGGSEKTKFYTGFGYKNIEGIVKNTSFERLSGIINLDNKAKEWLDLSFKTQMAYTKHNGSRDQSNQEQGIGTASALSLVMSSIPTKFAYDDEGNLNTGTNFNPSIDNALNVINRHDSYLSTKVYRVLTNGMIRISPIKDLTITSNNSADYNYSLTTEYWGPESIDGESLNGLGSKDNYQFLNLTTSNTIQYIKSINELHNFNVLAGYEAQRFKQDIIFTTAKDYSTTKLHELAVGKPSTASSYKMGYFMRSWFSNLDYNYDNKYYLQGSIRQDESSKLGKNNRKGTFWSVSGMWRFLKEDFLKNDLVTDGKIRVSYGTNGTLPGGLRDGSGIPTGLYEHLGLYNMGYTYGPESAIYIFQPESKDLGWEMSNNMNIGLDLTIKEKIFFTLEYYKKDTKDLLLYVPTSYITGFSSCLQNIGEVSNSGIDMEIHAYDILNSEFKWNADLNFSTLKATVEKLPNGDDLITGDGNLYIYSEKEDLYSFYLPTWLGVDPETGMGEFLIDPTKPDTKENRTYTYSQAKRSDVGKAYPDITGGFSNEFKYKGVTLRVLTTFQFGGNMFDYLDYFSHHDGNRVGTFNHSKEIVGNYWKKPGDVVDNPRPLLATPYRSDRWSTRYLYSTDFIRLKELSLSYNLPKQWINDIGINNINLSVSANNLAYLYAATEDKELEVPLNGYRTVTTPLPKTITFGLTIDF